MNMYLWLLTLVFVLACPAATIPTYVFHEKRNTEVSSDWVKRGLVHRDVALPVRVGMTQRNLDYGAELLLEISSPNSPKYGQHLSAQEVHELFAPSDETVEAISMWLKTKLPGRKVTQSVNKQWMQLEASTQELEDLFQTQYYVWEHISSSKQTVACDEYSVPRHLTEHIDYVTPGVKLHMPSAAISQMNKRNGIGAKSEIEAQELGTFQAREEPYHSKPQPFHGYKYCAHEMTPQCIQALYNVSGTFDAVKGNNIGVYAVSTDRYGPEALEGFFEKLYPKIPKATTPNTLYIDSPDYERPIQDGELSLDIQMAYPLIYPQNLTIWYVNDKYSYHDDNKINKTIHNYNPNDIFNSWLDAIDGSYCNYTAYGITGDTPGIDPTYPDHHAPGNWDHPLQCGVFKPTPVMTISYYQSESWLPVNFLKRQCSEYMKLGLQGISILFCSGDTGAAGGSGTPYPDSGDGCLGPGNPRKVFNPNFPASCPYVTGVGATVLPEGSDIFKYPEVVSSQSAGGFSNIWTTPEYQKNAIGDFLTKYPPPFKSYATKNGKNIGANDGIYNRKGRGYPDVSAVGEFTVMTFSNNGNVRFEYGGGTSASTPIVAGLITRINAARLKAGKKTVGFLNPTFYANPEAFHDVVEGESIGCVYKKTPGWNARSGWDPTTGLGSPDFGKLLEIFLKLP